jgi:hypothetical protein
MNTHFVVGKKFFVMAGNFFYLGRVASVSEYEVVLDDQSVLVYKTGASPTSLSSVIAGTRKPEWAEAMGRAIYLPLAIIGTYFEASENASCASCGTKKDVEAGTSEASAQEYPVGRHATANVVSR